MNKNNNKNKDVKKNLDGMNQGFVGVLHFEGRRIIQYI